MMPAYGLFLCDSPIKIVTSSKLPLINPRVQSIGSIQRQESSIVKFLSIVVEEGKTSGFKPP